MFKFVKSMAWFIKKNWYRYVLVLFFGILLTFINLIPATLTGRLADGIEQGILSADFLIFNIFIPFLITIGAIYAVATTKRLCQNRLTTTLYYALQVRYMENILV